MMKVWVALLFVALTTWVFVDGSSLRRYNEVDRSVNDDGMLLIHMLASQDGDEEEDLPNILELAEDLDLTKFREFVIKAGLSGDDNLSGRANLTVFGPINKSFRHLPHWIKYFISKDRAYLASLLKYHVLDLDSKLLSSDLENDLQVGTWNGNKLRFNLYGNSVATVQCSRIDLTKVDQLASNGVLHVVDKVLLPPFGSIADSLNTTHVFKNLTKAVKAGDLYDLLNGDGPFTMFAPIDRAFNKLPPGFMDNLYRNQTALQEVLKYHVISGTFCSSGMTSGPMTTLAGMDVQIDKSDRFLKVNGVKVTFRDFSVTNGVIHSMHSVLLPPSML